MCYIRVYKSQDLIAHQWVPELIDTALILCSWCVGLSLKTVSCFVDHSNAVGKWAPEVINITALILCIRGVWV